MQFGYFTLGVSLRSYGTVAQKAEAAGFDSFFMPEHLVFPIDITPLYPYSETGYPGVDADTPYFDPWVSLASVAAVTSKIRLGTQVYILPLRNVFVTAKAVATLDRISQGRVILGAGVGWLKEEFEAAGEDFHTRGRRADEAIKVIRRLWTEDTIEHHGEFYDFGPIKFNPKPSQKPCPPIQIGGETRAARRRAALLGDGWLSAGGDTPETAKPLIDEMQAWRREAGRDGPFEVSMRNALGENTLDNARRYEEAGVDRLFLRPEFPKEGRMSVDFVGQWMERMNEEIISRM